MENDSLDLDMHDIRVLEELAQNVVNRCWLLRRSSNGDSEFRELHARHLHDALVSAGTSFLSAANAECQAGPVLPIMAWPVKEDASCSS